VLDGVGGNNRGEVASGLAAAEITSTVIGQLAASRTGQSEFAKDEVLTSLRQAFVRANQAVLTAAATNPACRGMATTAVCAVLLDEFACLAWVGDSRAYLFRPGTLEQLTRDHTEVHELLELGLLDPDEAPGHPGTHTLTRYLGQPAGFDVETRLARVHPGDLLLLCTDGLTDVLDNRALAEFLSAYHQDDPAIDQLPIALARHALRLGTTDNVTVLCCWRGSGQAAETNRTCTGAYRLRRASTTQRLFQETTL
jgi:PPM family protein phosphatase